MILIHLIFYSMATFISVTVSHSDYFTSGEYVSVWYLFSFDLIRNNSHNIMISVTIIRYNPGSIIQIASQTLIWRKNTDFHGLAEFFCNLMEFGFFFKTKSWRDFTKEIRLELQLLDFTEIMEKLLISRK